MSNDLDIAFNIAFEKVSSIKRGLPQDVMLKLYAYNKQATSGNNFMFNMKESKESDIVNGFKFNAWMQLNGMSQEEAKQEYINLANTII